MNASHLVNHFAATTELPFTLMEYYLYTDDTQTLQNKIIPVANATIRFFDEKFQDDAQGKMYMFPANAVEKYSNCVNPSASAMGLKALLSELLELPESLSTAADRANWQRVFDRMKTVPTEEKNGQTVLKAADVVGNRDSNGFETPELYVVHPYKLASIGSELLDVGRLSFSTRDMFGKPSGGWNQGPINAAYSTYKPRSNQAERFHKR